MPVLTRLKEHREKAGLSPEQLSDLSRDPKTMHPEFSGQLVRRAEKGHGTELLKAKAIAKVLKLKLEVLQ
jgi:ribosome-binding protein aMBF1 (putative translation factor)